MEAVMKHILLILIAGTLAISCKDNRRPAPEKTPEAVEPAQPAEIQITQAEMDQASGIYFDKCAGCHGTMRVGATGPSLLPDGDGKAPATKVLGMAGLKAFIENGTPGGMPEWKGILTPEEIDLMARFLQVDPPEPPPFEMADVKETWKLLVPVAERPTKPQHKRNIDGYIGVIMRDAGKVAIIDGETYERIVVLDTGFAVHILRPSASGRYIYSIGRDGRITMIDTYPDIPTVVAEVRASLDARSVDGSKYKGEKGDFYDKYLIAGGYNPSHFVIFDAQTLEPLSLTKTSGNACCGDKEFVKEARVAAIVASHTDPIWVVNVKETGMVWLVDYTDPRNPKSTQIPTERFLHDGGWDASGKYFLVAANASDKIVVIDVPNQKLEKIIEVGRTPHPGRGANVKDPVLGSLWATSHLGDNTIQFIKTDPGEGQWTVVKKMEMPGMGGGSLFVKTHPKSKHFYADRTLNPDASLNSAIYVFDLENFTFKKKLEAPEGVDGRAVHIEFNQAGTEAWVSYFMGEKSALVVYDDETLEVKKIIQGDWVQNPTGKFNVYNTVNDVY